VVAGGQRVDWFYSAVTASPGTLETPRSWLTALQWHQATISLNSNNIVPVMNPTVLNNTDTAPSLIKAQTCSSAVAASHWERHPVGYLGSARYCFHR